MRYLRSPPPQMLSGSTLCFHFFEQIIPWEEVIFHVLARQLLLEALMGAERTAAEMTVRAQNVSDSHQQTKPEDGGMEVQYMSVSKSESHVMSHRKSLRESWKSRDKMV